MITGYGRAEKIQVQQMIKQLLRLDELPPNDAADALAIAVCRAWQRLEPKIGAGHERL
jgi:crossover junction endodeoxyribonuclease RuvC